VPRPVRSAALQLLILKPVALRKLKNAGMPCVRLPATKALPNLSPAYNLCKFLISLIHTPLQCQVHRRHRGRLWIWLLMRKWDAALRTLTLRLVRYLHRRVLLTLALPSAPRALLLLSQRRRLKIFLLRPRPASGSDWVLARLSLTTQLWQWPKLRRYCLDYGNPAPPQYLRGFCPTLNGRWGVILNGHRFYCSLASVVGLTYTLRLFVTI